MKKPTESRVVTQSVDEVLARYNDEAEITQSDSVQLGLLRERYLGDYLELSPDLHSHFENENAV